MYTIHVQKWHLYIIPILCIIICTWIWYVQCSYRIYEQWTYKVTGHKMRLLILYAFVFSLPSKLCRWGWTSDQVWRLIFPAISTSDWLVNWAERRWSTARSFASSPSASSKSAPASRERDLYSRFCIKTAGKRKSLICIC